MVRTFTSKRDIAEVLFGEGCMLKRQFSPAQQPSGSAT
jgi:hypothetical protein